MAASIDTWYGNHQSDTIATVVSSLRIDEQAMTQLSTSLLPVVHDAIESEWLTAHTREMLQAFYEQPNIKKGLAFNA